MDVVAPLELDAATAPPPDPDAEPDGFVVEVDDGSRIHFLDWGGPRDAAAGSLDRTDPTAGDGGANVLLVHGIAATAWIWAPVARRLAASARVVAVDLRGHGLSDAPTGGYEEPTLAGDLRAVIDGTGLGSPLIVAGHGFGAIVAAWTAASLGDRCAGLVLVDGGWEAIEEASGMEAWEFLRSLDEPPEVYLSMPAFLADRASYDPSTWDADQERAARASVVELPVGRLEAAVHDHVRTASVQAMFAYDPVATLMRVTAPISVLMAADDEWDTHAGTLGRTATALRAAGRPPVRLARFPTDGHNLMRYRPADVAAAILAAGA